MNNPLLPTLVVLVGVVASLSVYDVTQVAISKEAQGAQVYSSLQGAVQAFLGLGGTTNTPTGGGYNSTTNNTQTYSSFDGGDASFDGSVDSYAAQNGFPDDNYDDGFATDNSIRQTGAGIQTTETTNIYSTTENTVNTQQTSSGAAVTTASITAPNSLSIEGANPVLSCIPGSIVSGEPTMVFYACGDASTNATGTGFDTAGSTQGALRVNPTSTTTLEVACEQGTSAQCLVEVIDPSLAIIATPSNVARNGIVDISWRGVDVKDCVVKSNRHTSFVRQGIEGDAPSPSIAQDTTFTLICETEVGTVETRSVTVTVR